MARNELSEKKMNVATVVVVVLVIALGIFLVVRYRNPQSAPLNANDPKVALAQCLTDKGVKMYGAYWCPHCAAQKKDFGSAFEKVTYVECAIPGDSTGQTQACKDQKIEGYPTWIFADGSRVSGEQALEDLADKAGCSYNGVRPSSVSPSNTNASSAPQADANAAVVPDANGPSMLEVNTNASAAPDAGNPGMKIP